MAIYTDHLNRTVHIPAIPKRIVSVVPSQTELLYTLGLEAEVVGVTKFCIHPENWLKSKTIVGGTKNLHRDRIIALQPDLIIANKEENIQEQIETLATTIPVWVSDVQTIEQAYTMMQDIGIITGKAKLANKLVDTIREGFLSIQNNSSPDLKNKLDTLEKPACTYLIWKDPYLTVGGDTFIHHMLLAAGFSNVFGAASRYPEINIQAIRESNTTHLLLSSEPYPFKVKHLSELQQQLPDIKILLVDGELFSWYGSRMLTSATYFAELRNQEFS